MDKRTESGVLVVILVFSQKYRPLLEAIATFLEADGIHCVVQKVKPTVHEIRVRRIDDVCRLLRRMDLILKRDQSRAVLDYFEGKVTGDQVLQIFDTEYRAGKRRTSPLDYKVSFPLTYSEAITNAKKARASAARLVNLVLTREYFLQGMKLLPDPFTTADVARVFKCSTTDARYRVLRMEANGLVSCKIRRSRGRGMLTCSKLVVQ